jgi:hypothetical protein
MGCRDIVHDKVTFVIEGENADWTVNTTLLFPTEKKVQGTFPTPDKAIAFTD